ncbi:MAG: multifunctional CCA addition/repair protein [Burkholderiales bacterium]
MQVYLVGGAVRDRLLGQPTEGAARDRDWVVVGTTPEALRAAGYLPVGRDFPVFLHPDTKEEYALARTERKSGRGYHGFVFHAGPEVTLEDDLARRDLTVNAMAEDEAGRLIDPYHGAQDLAARLLRHVGPAFAEDPVRILRLARFAARWPDFSVADETLALCRQMVADGEVDALVPERVWQELARGLMEVRPSRMLDVLRGCGALARLLPELDRLWGVPQRAEYHPEIDTGVHVAMVLDMAARLAAPLTVRFACLAHDLGKGTTPRDVLPRHIGHEARSVRLLQAVAERLKVPNDCRALAEVVAKEHTAVHQSQAFGAAAVVRLLQRCDAWRRPQRFEELLLACECDARGRLGFDAQPYPQRARLSEALAVTRAVAVGAVAASVQGRGTEAVAGDAIARAVRAARQQALAAHWQQPDEPDAPPEPRDSTAP